MHEALDNQLEFYSLKAASNVLRLQPEIILKQLADQDLLYIDAQRSPVVPLYYLRQFSGFGRLASSPATNSASPSRLVPRLKRDEPTAPKKQLFARLPFRFQGPPISQGAKEMPKGQIWEQEHLWNILTYSQLPKRTTGCPHYSIDALDNAYSWASPAEASFRRGAQAIVDLITERKTLPTYRPKTTDPYWAVNSKKTVDEQDGIQAQQEAQRKYFQSRKRLQRAAIPVPDGAVVRYDTTERFVRPSTAFGFQPKSLHLPDPIKDRKRYLSALPLDFLEIAWDEATTWANLLMEERTCYIRSYANTKGVPDEPMEEVRVRYDRVSAEHREAFDKKEIEIESQRLAWTNGILMPLMPTGFQFLF